jgi:hypothetical protein
MRIRHYLLRTVASWILLLAFVLLTHPQNLPVLFFVAPFILLFFALNNLWRLAAALVRRLSDRPDKAENRRLRLTACGGAVLFLIMQSLGQLTLRDVCTILAITIIGYLYIGRTRSGTA